MAGEAPKVFGLRLALALVDLTGNLTMAGDEDTAMDAALRAQQVCERIPETESQREGFEPRLAESLSVIGHRFAASGQLNQAVRALKAVVEIFRRLSAAAPREFDPSLAAALANLGGVLCAANRPAEAETAQRTALEIMRRLPGGAEHEPVIALMSAGLSDACAQAGHWEEALEAIENAVEILQRHAPADEDHAEHLAQCIRNRTAILGHLGQEERPA
jgi:tetratricopeptide (TPR) repeat protein